MELNVFVLIKELKAKHGYAVKYIKCDNAGENLALDMASKQEGLCIHFDYTMPSTPQQNRRLEQKIATLLGRIHVMLNASGLINFCIMACELRQQNSKLVSDLNSQFSSSFFGKKIEHYKLTS